MEKLVKAYLLNLGYYADELGDIKVEQQYILSSSEVMFSLGQGLEDISLTELLGFMYEQSIHGR